MVRQAFDLLGQAVPGERLEGLDDAGVQRPPPLLQQAAVGHLVGEGVLEGVVALGEEARLVEELGGLEVRQAAMQRRLGQLGNGLQQGKGTSVPMTAAVWRSASPRRAAGRCAPPDRLHRGRHLDGWQRPGQAIGARLADQHPGLHQGPHALLQEEGDCPRCARSAALERLPGWGRRPAGPGGARRRSPGGSGSSRSCV